VLLWLEEASELGSQLEAALVIYPRRAAQDCNVVSEVMNGNLSGSDSNHFDVMSPLTDESPTKFIRVLGEDLVLFKDKSGNVGLIADHCVHRGASLLYGRTEERGIACAYHGWLYDTTGNCLETPTEPAESSI
jgi:nitrite reductase/ring-hydroxylating ferredoxin subunit